jgi:predicted transcriptional regulator
MISFVRASLEARTGRLRAIAEDTGISYDTLLRIKNGEGDPGYSKVARLSEYLRGLEAQTRSVSQQAVVQ